MKTALVWALLGTALGASESNGPKVRVADRTPLALVVHSPTGESGAVSFSDMIRALDDRLRRYTDFEGRSVDSALFEGCEGRLSCLVRATRRDYQRERLRLPDGEYAPYAKHRMRLEQEGVQVTRYMLIVTQVAVPGRPDRVIAHLFNTDLALRAYHETPRVPGWVDKVEERVLEEAALARYRQAELKPEGVQEFADTLFREALQPALETTGHWLPYGQVWIENAPAGASIELDGRTVGVTSENGTLLADVAPGARRIRLLHPKHQSFETQVAVNTGQRTPVRAQMNLKRASRPIGPKAVFWTGIATAAAGAGILAYAIAADPNSQTVCFGEGVCEAGNRFQTTSLQGTNPGSVDLGSEGSLLLAPLGYSLIGAGASFSVGAKTFDRNKTIPWWSLGLGVAVGGLAYGISAAAN